MPAESEHGLRVQLATALRERDEAREHLRSMIMERDMLLTECKTAESALAAARRECAEQCEAKEAAYAHIYKARDLLGECDDALARVQGHGCPPSDELVSALRKKIRAALGAPGDSK